MGYQLGETGLPTLRDFLTDLSVIRRNIKLSLQLETGRRSPFIGG
jgi:hypothetical protein